MKGARETKPLRARPIIIEMRKKKRRRSKKKPQKGAPREIKKQRERKRKVEEMWNSVIKSIKERERDIKLLNIRVANLTGEIADAESANSLEIAERENQIATLQRELDELTNTRKRLTEKNSTDTQTISSLQATISTLESDAESMRSEQAQLSAAISALETELSSAKDSNKAGAVENKQVNDKLAKTESSLAVVETSLKKLQDEKLAAQQARETAAAQADVIRDAIIQSIDAANLQGVAVQDLGDDNTVAIRLGSGDLFAPGSAKLSREGADKLTRLGKIIKDFDDRSIVVEGHTDNVPIGPDLKQRFESNWELSVARSATAVRHMQWQAGIKPGRMTATGYGEYYPIASNDTQAGKRLNRRVDIILRPNR